MRSLRDISIRNKIIILCAVVFLLASCLGVIGFVNMLGMKDATKNTYDEVFLEAQMFMELTTDLEDARRALLTLLSESDSSRFSYHREAITDATRAVDDNIAFMLNEDNHFDEEAIDGITELREVWSAFKDTREKVLIPAIYEGRVEAARQLAMGVQEERYQSFVSIAKALVEHEKHEATLAQQTIEERFLSSIKFYVLAIILGFIVAVFSVLYINRSIIKRIRRIEAAVSTFDAEKSELKLPVGCNDELGVLAGSVNKMSRRLYEDGIAQKQYVQILEYEGEEKRKRAEELKGLNEELSVAHSDISEKNKELNSHIDMIEEANKERDEAKSQMIQSEKLASIGQLAAGVAHEINNPVGFVLSNLETMESYIKDLFALIMKFDETIKTVQDSGTVNEAKLKELDALKSKIDIEFLAEDALALISESLEGAERVRQIVADLKDFSRVDTVESTYADLNSGIESTLNMACNEFKYKASVKKELGSLPEVRCNPGELNQVFMNLIINAGQSIEENGEIGVRTYYENDRVFIEISDTGCGIPEDDQAKIFDPFYTTKPVGQGTGLGLALTQTIVKKHGGKISVKSKVGSGTTFIVSIPVEQELAANE